MNIDSATVVLGGCNAVSSAHAPVESAPRRFEFIDTLRGFAILGVIVIHASLKVPELSGRLQRLGLKGMYGVQLFFVISALTLFWSLRNRVGTEHRPFGAFFLRRIFRVAPLFWIGAMIYLAFPIAEQALHAPNGIGWQQVVTNLLFVHGWYPTTLNSVVPGGWTMAAEAMFYLCVPFLFMYVRTLHRALWLALLSTAAVHWLTPIALARLVPLFPAEWNELVSLFVYFSFPSQLPVFCLGIVIYFLLTDRSPRSHPPALFLTALAAFLVFGRAPHHVVAGVGCAALVYGLAHRPFRWLVNPLTQFVGTISYSAYIWHSLVLDRAAPWAMQWGSTPSIRFLILLGLGLVITLPLATASYWLIEQPFQKLGKLLIARLGWGVRRTVEPQHVQLYNPAHTDVSPATMDLVSAPR